MMDQKSKVVARLAERFAGPSLPGDQGKEKVQAEDAGGAVATRVEPAQAEGAQPKAAAGQSPIQARYAHLDPITRGIIDSLLALESGYPIRAFLTEDGLRAGVVFGPSVKEFHWAEFQRYSRLFFGPAHEAICSVFENELKAVGRRYGKNQGPVESTAAMCYSGGR